MENPADWDMLTSSLAVCNLQKPDKVWAFLVLQGLVRDLPGDRDFFYGIINREKAYGAITGPSLQGRIARRLREFDIALASGAEPDPNAETAKKRLNTLNNLMGIKEPAQILRKSLFCIYCGAESDKLASICAACGKGLRPKPETCLKYCERCRGLSPLSAHFCQDCGNRFADLQDPISPISLPRQAEPPSLLWNKAQPRQTVCERCGHGNIDGHKFCPRCGAYCVTNNDDYHPTNAHVANSFATNVTWVEPILPDNTLRDGIWESRLFRLAEAARNNKVTADLWSVLVNVIQDMVVIKQVLTENGIWDEEIYRKLRTERMIGDYSGAGATPWKSYSQYPYSLDEEEFLKHVFNASKEEIEEFKKKAETASELT